MSLLKSHFNKILNKQDKPDLYLELPSKCKSERGNSLSKKKFNHHNEHALHVLKNLNNSNRTDLKNTNIIFADASHLQSDNKLLRFKVLKPLIALGIPLFLFPVFVLPVHANLSETNQTNANQTNANTPALVAPKVVVKVSNDDSVNNLEHPSEEPSQSNSDTNHFMQQTQSTQPTQSAQLMQTTHLAKPKPKTDSKSKSDLQSESESESNTVLIIEQASNTEQPLNPNHASNTEQPLNPNHASNAEQASPTELSYGETLENYSQEGADEYIYAYHNPATYQQTDSISNTNAINIDEIGKSLENGSYQVIELQSIVDPITGITIEDSYSVKIPENISLMQAQNVLTQVSPKLAANNAAIQANELQSIATEDLNKPWVFFRAGATHYNLDADIDLREAKADINDGINQAIQDQLANTAIDPNLIPDIPPIISQRIPDSYQLEREDTNINAGVAVFWPIYTAGRTQAITELADARTDESEADALIDSDELYTTLIDRYFTAQLAVLGAYLSEDALNTVKETDYMAQRMLEEGFISRVERLEAQSALADAQSRYVKAHNDAELAMTALQRLLRSPYPIKPTTPLFVMSSPLPPIEHFQDLALQNHPGLKKVDAKYAQAESLSHLSDTEYKPTVSLFGYHEVDNDPSWIAGVSASWKLWGGINTSAQHASSQAQMRQAQLSKIEVSDNILLLVEKNWQSVENARVQYQSLNENVALAQELLRLKQVGLREGVNTALDVSEAQTKLLKAKTEQASAANDYVQALAALMQSIGNPHAFNEYMAVADVKLPTVY